MHQARVRHSATLLDDGRVLVAGGKDYSRAHNTAEIYDPQKETWSSTPKMTNRRTSHEAALLHDGRVLVSGGWSTVVAGRTLLRPTLSSAEIFDPIAR